MKKSKGLLLIAVACAAFATVLLNVGCNPECVDNFDCRDKAKAGESLVCSGSKCVPAPPPKCADGGSGLPDGGC